MVTVKRVTTDGAMIQIAASDPAGQTPAQVFYFFPAGSSDGPTSNLVPDWAADAIMTDPAIAHHFECTPPRPAAVGVVDVDAHDAGPVATTDKKAKK